MTGIIRRQWRNGQTALFRNKWLYAVILLFLTGCTRYPSWIIWEENSIVLPGGHSLAVKDKTVYVDEQEIFDQDWKCAKALTCDLDQDGEEEILMLIWNHMDYGDYHPFWEEKDEKTLREHVYIYNFRDGTMKPNWMSSFLDPEIMDIEVNGNELTVTDPHGEITLWQWKTYSIERIK